MNINAEAHFKNLPTLGKNIYRTIFPMPQEHITTFNAGKLVPIYSQKYMPGDTFSMNAGQIARMSTLLTPYFGRLQMEVAFFAVDERLVWDHYKEYRGENTEDEWEPEVEYEKPQLKPPTGGFKLKSVACYLGAAQPGIENVEVDHLPIRAYCKIWNDHYRDQNLQRPIKIDKGDATTIGSNGEDWQIDAILGGEMLPVNKLHDVFTTCLPEPQKGPDVMIPLGTTAPVYPAATQNDINLVTGNKLLLANNNGAAIEGSSLLGTKYSNGQAYLAAAQTPAAGTLYDGGVTFTNLQADLRNARGALVNDLRDTLTLQHMYEADARGGSRFNEIIRMHFGIATSDANADRSEFLGSTRITLGVNQVVQTSQTTETSPQGSTAGFSLTANYGHVFTKSFDTWGYIIAVAYVRNKNMYQQGIEKQWFEKRRFDEYWPLLANIGEQAVLNKEIKATGTETDNEVFGYQEAWYNWRYRVNRVSGEFRSGIENSLDCWHLADNYNKQPILGSEWIQATKNNIDRVLAVTSEQSDQFHVLFNFDPDVTRVMPLYSEPGLSRI